MELDVIPSTDIGFDMGKNLSPHVMFPLGHTRRVIMVLVVVPGDMVPSELITANLEKGNIRINVFSTSRVTIGGVGSGEIIEDLKGLHGYKCSWRIYIAVTLTMKNYLSNICFLSTNMTTSVSRFLVTGSEIEVRFVDPENPEHHRWYCGVVKTARYGTDVNGSFAECDVLYEDGEMVKEQRLYDDDFGDNYADGADDSDGGVHDDDDADGDFMVATIMMLMSKMMVMLTNNTDTGD